MEEQLYGSEYSKAWQALLVTCLKQNPNHKRYLDPHKCDILEELKKLIAVELLYYKYQIGMTKYQSGDRTALEGQSIDQYIQSFLEMYKNYYEVINPTFLKSEK